jgi:hypothetical protein
MIHENWWKLDPAHFRVSCISMLWRACSNLTKPIVLHARNRLELALVNRWNFFVTTRIPALFLASLIVSSLRHYKLVVTHSHVLTFPRTFADLLKENAAHTDTSNFYICVQISYSPFCFCTFPWSSWMWINHVLLTLSFLQFSLQD